MTFADFALLDLNETIDVALKILIPIGSGYNKTKFDRAANELCTCVNGYFNETSKGGSLIIRSKRLIHITGELEKRSKHPSSTCSVHYLFDLLNFNQKYIQIEQLPSHLNQQYIVLVRGTSGLIWIRVTHTFMRVG